MLLVPESMLFLNSDQGIYSFDPYTDLIYKNDLDCYTASSLYSVFTGPTYQIGADGMTVC